MKRTIAVIMVAAVMAMMLVAMAAPALAAANTYVDHPTNGWIIDLETKEY